MSISQNIEAIASSLPSGVKLVAVSKYHPLSAVLEAYADGQRAFGESRPQEFAAKAVQLPQDIEWHFIGHLQTNKLKLVLPYASLVESVDSEHLLEAISAWGEKNSKCIDVLLEVHIGAEQTKQGFSAEEVLDLIPVSLPFVRVRGLMGMASHTDDDERIEADFELIQQLFEQGREIAQKAGNQHFDILSIGMSHDWRLALAYGSTEVRIGTSIFGNPEI